jgi:SAM-dependent methyltransferase
MYINVMASNIPEKIRKSYIETTDAELEFRSEIDRNEWINMYKSQILTSNTYTVKKSLIVLINITAATERNRPITRRLENYIDDKGKFIPSEQRWMEKSVLDSGMMGGVRLVLSMERRLDPVADPPKNYTASSYRLRIRYSTTWLTNWRLDLTIVKNVTGSQAQNINALQIAKDYMFPPGKAVDPLELDDSSLQYEIEVEHISDLKSDLQVSTMKQVASQIESYIKPGTLNSEYSIGIRDLAQKIGITPKRGNANRTISSLKELVNAPKVFTKETYHSTIYRNITKYYISDKADGDRVLLYYNKTGDWQVVSNINISPLTTALRIPSQIAVIDCERVEKEYYAFDLLMWGVSVIGKPFHERLELLHTVCGEIGLKVKPQILLGSKPVSRRKTPDQSKTTKGKTPDQTKTSKGKTPDQSKTANGKTPDQTKSADPVKDLISSQIRSMASEHSSMGYVSDGIIFTPADGLYVTMSVYKYKNPERQTIDFLIMQAPASVMGTGPYKNIPNRDLYFLFCGTGREGASHLQKLSCYSEIFQNYTIRDEFYPIQFAPHKYDRAYMYYHPRGTSLAGQVGEFVLKCPDQDRAGVASRATVEQCEWQLVKLRPDKEIDVRNGTSYGNSFKVAEMIFLNYFDPMTVDFLINPQVTSYFSEAKSPIYQASTKFNAFVKAQIMRQLWGKDTVIDLASGNGQDLFVYSGYRIKNLVMAERDKNALSEISRRAEMQGDAKLYLYANPPPKNQHTNVIIKELDIAARPEYRFNDLGVPSLHGGAGADAVVMNFAIHYFMESTTSRANLLNMVDAVLKPGGIFLFTCLNGAYIHQLFQPIGADTEPTENMMWMKDETTKYHIRRLYERDLTAVGQRIAVLLPFSNELKEEYLVNVQDLIGTLLDRGYTLRQNASFGDWIARYMSTSRGASIPLDEHDRQYCSLYRYVSLIKPLKASKKAE